MSSGSASKKEQNKDDAFELNMAQWSSYFTFDVMGDLIFGQNLGLLDNTGRRELPTVIDASVHDQYLLGQSPFIRFWRLDRYISPRLAQGTKHLLQYAEQLTSRGSTEESDRKDVLYHLMNAKNRDGSVAYANPGDLIAESRMLVVAGSDTTATQIAANFYYLTRSPRALARLTSEIRSAFDSLDSIRLGPQLDGCRYLHAVVEEALRLSPSVPSVLPREVLPGWIKAAGTVFPAGSEIAVPIYAIHRNSIYYPDPHTYKPERWLADENEDGEDGVARAWSAFHPFSYGTRQCIGKRLAYFEIWLVLARTLWQFDIERVDGIEEQRQLRVVDEGEYRLWDHFAAARKGPIVRFRVRQD